MYLETDYQTWKEGIYKFSKRNSSAFAITMSPWTCRKHLLSLVPCYDSHTDTRSACCSRTFVGFTPHAVDATQDSSPPGQTSADTGNGKRTQQIVRQENV